MARCCLVLGDQLSDTLPSLLSLDADDCVLMAEVWSEATYVKHHKQKIALIFSAMRHFADRLRAQGRQVHYVTLDDETNTHDLVTEIQRHQTSYGFSEWVITEPGEWRLLDQLRQLSQSSEVPLTLLPDTRFIATAEEFAAFLKGRKQPRMEHFYRVMRRKTGILMSDDQPMGGQWNFDADNRKSFPGGVTPAPMRHPPDAVTRDVFALVEARFSDHFGTLDQFFWPVTQAQAESVLNHFLRERLPFFGDYQDALVAGNDTLFHSLISTALNIGFLDPLAVCRRAEAEYLAGRAPLNAVEGFIRQILGWREYVRGLYWAYMPEYKTRNALGATEPLPGFFWDESQTDMRCLGEAIRNTRQHAYAHHIQRLMVTGNFALLLGASVDEVTDWYLSVYADAFEWVELPNTLGMALFADGGLMGSKPYCASGKYIDRMSDYCKGCRYQVKDTLGDDACPLNALYWDFLLTHRDSFHKNPRMAMVLRNVDRMDDAKVAAIQAKAQAFRLRLRETGSDRLPSAQEVLL